MNLLIIDRPSWHVDDLVRAAASDHAISVASYNDLAVAFSNNVNQASHFWIAGQDIRSYDAILIRAMPASSLEQIVFRMDVLNQIERQYGVPIVNPAKSIESSVDKYLSLELMRQFDLPVPATHVCQTADAAMDYFRSMGERTVIKPIFGSQGRGVALLNSVESASERFAELESAGSVIYQQRFIEHGDSDIRVLVNGGQLFAMKRQRPGHWVTNASQGASCHPHDLNDLERELALSAAHSQGTFLAGVDIVYDNDMPFVIEVNACPSWKHMSSALDTDISAAILYMIARLAGQEVV